MSTMVPMYGFGGGGGTGAALTVTAPAGCTVTVSKDGKTKTKVAGADGVAVFRGLATGQWTVNMTDGVQTAPAKTADITADYAITMSFFAATINVTYPAGSTCTATDGTTTLTAPDTSGTWDCVVPNAGTWTVSLDSGFAETVTITEVGGTQTLDKWHLYNHGDERTNVTGGWWIVPYSGITGQLDKGADAMTVTGSSNIASAVAVTEKSLDVSKFRKACFNVKSLNNEIFLRFLTTRSPSDLASATVAEVKATTAGLKMLDISSLSSASLYPALTTYMGSGKVDEIYLMA